MEVRDQPSSLGRKAILPLRRMKVHGIDDGNVPGFCKRRQVARREEVDAGDAQCRALPRRSPRPVGEEPEQVEGDLVAALLQETRNAFRKRLGETIKLPLPHLHRERG